ncbi:MAG: 3'-5' exonuclease [Pseudomonadota bacterium]
MNVLVFDIETVPDTQAGQRLFGLDGLPAEDVARAMAHLRQQQSGSEFMPHHLQRIVAISIVLRTAKSLKVWSLGELDSTESELLERFFDGIQRFDPILVSWNGSGFDLPVIHYRSLLHGVAAPRYWETGQQEQSFRYNNYLGRFHWRHTDLMDVLAGYQPRGFAPLDQLSSMLGFPGKMGMTGAKVWETFLNGDIGSIRDYCETDVINTYLIYLRFELLRGHLDEVAYMHACEQLRSCLAALDKAHLNQFLTAWDEGAS